MPEQGTPRYGDLIETSVGADPRVRGRVVQLDPLVISVPGGERIEVEGDWVPSTFPTHVQRTTDGLVAGQMVRLSSHLVTSSIHLRGWVEEVISPASLQLRIRTESGLRTETIRLSQDVWITQVPEDTSAWLATVPCGVFGVLLSTTHLLIEDEGVRVYRDGFEITEGCVQQCRSGDELRIMTRVGKRLDTQTFSAGEGYRWATLPADQSQYLRQQIKRPVLQMTKTAEPAQVAPEVQEQVDVQALRERHRFERQDAAVRRAFRQELLGEVATGLRALAAKRARQEEAEVTVGLNALPTVGQHIDLVSIASGLVVSSGVARQVFPDFVWCQESEASWSRFFWSSYTWREHVESRAASRRPFLVSPSVGQRIDVLRVGTDEVLITAATVDWCDQWSIKCGPNTFYSKDTWWRPAQSVPALVPVLPPDPVRRQKVRRRWGLLWVGMIGAGGATLSLLTPEASSLATGAMLGLTVAVVGWVRNPMDRATRADRHTARQLESLPAPAELLNDRPVEAEPVREDLLDEGDRDRVDSLRRRTGAILQRTDLSTTLRIEVQRLGGEHLDTAVRDYLDLKDAPRAGAQAQNLFIEALDLIEAGVVRAEDVVAHQLLRRQQEHRNYLRDVLGQSSLDLGPKD